MARRHYSLKRQKEVLEESLSDMRGLGIVFEFDIDGVLGRSRLAEFVFQRAVMAMYLKHRKGMDSVMIGGILGRDHATVLHMLKDRKAKQNWGPRYYIFAEAIQNGTIKNVSARFLIAHYRFAEAIQNGTIKNVSARFLIAHYRKAIRILEEKIERNG